MSPRSLPPPLEHCRGHEIPTTVEALKRRLHKSRPTRQEAPKPRDSARPSPTRITPFKQWLFHLVVAVGLPLVALVLVELGLRLAGYGYATDFFKPLRIGNRDLLVENDSFGFRFFPREIARMPSAFRIPAKKAPGTYRIFILGESAAMGDPEPAFGAGRYLEALLRERYPQAKFEVVNVAMTAINSHVILPIARDCARQDGDLWIVYMGNNEMIGPFGVATPNGVQSPRSVEFVRLSLAIQKTRLGQLISDVGQKLSGSRSKPWMGMQMFAGNLVAPDDRRRQQVYRNFERNLRDILRAGLDSGAHVLLSTVAVNLKDCPPFGSLISSNLSSMDRAQVERLLAEGNALAQETNYVAAVRRYEQAVRLNPRSAELEFRLGDGWRQLTNLTTARAHFEQACDLDCSTFRANSQINQLIREAGRALDASQLTLFDARLSVATDHADPIPGQEVFFEHVHFNFDGNYRLARGWAQAVARLLPAGITNGDMASWAAQEICERRLGLTDWDRGNVLREVRARLEHPPLSVQFNHAERLQVLTEWQTELRRRRDVTNAASTAHSIYVEALRAAPEDYCLRANFGNFLWDTGDIDQAIEQWQKVRDLIPQDHAAYFELGRLARVQGKFAEAKSLLGRAVAMRPSFAPGWFELGEVQAAEGKYEQAVEAYDRALVFQPQDPKCWFNSGIALALLDRRAEAMTRYRRVVQFDPADWRAHFELGSLLGKDGKMTEAKSESAEAVRLNPEFPAARLNLGMALVQLGQLDEAEGQFEAALRLDPTNSRASDYLAQTRALKIRKP
jgi:tetratricopeptide (TPR) repeat protein